ncbi:CBS domain-containing protein [Haliscomenobacter hydrossis]|uniref:CBS domain containing protein n=1 Tax=Haliscomenobacter hydrossis (strain ATCC 27775 / DSM 1100 / LMG 10767 / O) TaxID=760192 RepID=F4KXF9_HALH1|nr:CBS domain-containing protein [Haliscomenobacter hydrossis]AEE50330.1 CBS domain containing protein [Haliscomenobacter hydrossis DSM 1100]
MASNADSPPMLKFMRALLADIEAVEYMLNHQWFESGVARIGAEQEMCLVDLNTYKPLPLAVEILELMKDCPWLDTELARFNLEVNLDPQEFSGACFQAMEQEIHQRLQHLRHNIAPLNADVILTGILPTIRKHDLERHNLTPRERYNLLIDAMSAQRNGQAFEFRLRGIDELQVRHDTPLLEACNTSFQIHLQVDPSSYAQMYNFALALAGPTLALGANSPIVFGRRLWHESRIALFQQALDVRTTHDHLRERSTRVYFGNNWVEHSILDIYREDLARFRTLIARDADEDVAGKIRSGETPLLLALRLHNSSIYRWNRPYYGISPNGKPHLRIENRILPAGPTVVDQIANTAFWTGAMIGCQQNYADVRQKMSWEDARSNFEKSAAFGLDSKFSWFDGKKISARELLLQELIPLARQGLTQRQVDSKDIDYYLGIAEERMKRHTNGAIWQLNNYSQLRRHLREDEALVTLTAAMHNRQKQNIPVHEWTASTSDDLPHYRASTLKVEEFMTTDLFTVQKDDLIQLVANLMDWRRIRYLPVEDTKGHLCGLITSRLVLRHLSKQTELDQPGAQQVQDIMIAEPVSVHPSMLILDAIKLMRDKKIGCLPVVQNEELVGIITENDFLDITARLIEQLGKG